MLLTNADRVKPKPEDDKIVSVRPALHDAVMQALKLVQ